MRGSKLQGRFHVDYEAKSIYEGIGEELGATVGQEVDWYQWSDEYLADNYDIVVDPIYDVSNYGIDGDIPGGIPNGRRWATPFKLPTVMAQLIRSTNVMNERGFYVSDTLRLVVNVGEIQRLVPAIMDNPSLHIKDRIVYRNEVFVPTRVLPRGSFGYRYAVVTIDCNQVNAEELVNDPQFAQFASPSWVDPRTPPPPPPPEEP